MIRSLLVTTLALAALPGAAMAADAAHPAVIELYQSQGCSSCPPALAVLRDEANRPDVLALSFAVTYWDQLGWKDSFAQPAFTARQWDYARAGHRAQVATPQLVVNGRGVVNGGNRAEVDAAIARFARPADGPEIMSAAGKVTIGAARSTAPATVWLVDYDPRTLAVAINAGENGGRTLPHRNIVRRLRSIGRWQGVPETLPLGAPVGGLRRAVLVQQGSGGPIIAARTVG